MRVLIACEFSGIVREAFKLKGHDAWSCDLLETEIPGNHYKEDIRELLKKDDKWDMIIAHPPCTHLAVSGARWFKDKIEEQKAAIEFFLYFTRIAVPKVAIENPISIMSRLYRKPDQIIEPWWFGHLERKATCLWLKNLPRLRPTKILEHGMLQDRIHRASPGKDRWKERSRTYKGIAEAMAKQWGI